MKPPFKIKQVRVYQAVTFEGRSETYFTNPDYMTIKGTKAEQTLEEMEDGCVIVRSSRDMIKIGFANIAFIQYDQLQPTDATGTALADAVKQDAAMRAEKARLENDRTKIIAEKEAKEKSTLAALKAEAAESAKKLRAEQKAAKAATTVSKQD